MSNQFTNSKDFVDGGEKPPPVGDSVPGGLTELNQRFEHSQLEQKLATLTEATKYGEEGVPLLLRGLEDNELRVRTHAYEQLKIMKNTPPELARGIPLKEGDRIYGVYQSSINTCPVDGWLLISPPYKDICVNFYFYHTTEDAMGFFEYVSEEEAKTRESCKLIAYYVDQPTAEALAEDFYLEALSRVSPVWIHPDKPEEDFELKAWVEANGVILEEEIKKVWNSYNHEGLLKYDQEKYGFDRDYSYRVLISLYTQKRLDLVREIWQRIGYKPLISVFEHIIDRPCYLKMGSHDNSRSQLYPWRSFS